MRSMAQKDHLRVVTVGAGATGVELVAELSRLLELAAGYGIEDVRGRLQLTLLESGPRILGAFPEAVSASTTEQLRQIGVTVRTGVRVVAAEADGFVHEGGERRSEEHTSELQSLMRRSYAVFCLKKTNTNTSTC